MLWHVLEPVTADDIAHAPQLRLIHKVGVGLDTIDLEAAATRNIAVCNTPGVNSRAVAELTLGLMLATLRRIVTFDGETRRGDGWTWPVQRQDELGEIHGRTVGIVGYGAVARCLAPTLKAMGAHVVYTDVAAVDGVDVPFVDLPELLRRADIVTLHVPLLPATRHLIDTPALALMKPGAVLINCARGGLVDEEALVVALQSGQLSAAGLDTFLQEPAETSNPLFALPNVVVTPHIAWLTQETLNRTLDILVDNCRRLEAGAPLLHQVAPR